MSAPKPPLPSFIERLPLTRRALDYAARLHAGQRRDTDRAPFIIHPLEVASLLYATGSPEEVIAAGVLHDALENSDATVADVRERFGSEVADLVAALTEDASIPSYARRKRALRDQIQAAGDQAASVFAADKVAKIRELRALRTRHGAQPAGPRLDQRKLDHYLASLETLESSIPEHPLVRQLRFELEMLVNAPLGEQAVSPPPDVPAPGDRSS